MKFFTLNEETVLPGATYDAHFTGIGITAELEASHDCVYVPRGNDWECKILKASMEVWNLSRYLVPERNAGSALLVLDFSPPRKLGFQLSVHGPKVEVIGGEMLGESLVRIAQGKTCRIQVSESDERPIGFYTQVDVKPTVFDCIWSGCFLKVERNGKLMEADNFIA